MMLKVLNVSGKDMLEQLKLSCQVPGLLDAIATRKIIYDAARVAGIKVEVQELQQSADSLIQEKFKELKIVNLSKIKEFCLLVCQGKKSNFWFDDY
ncbi:hypothetical protein [Scytonema sp. PRP1]|uniref:hypothetical protein n=1 Tax=Scytonema sp. PRP1 TaxID=3120513 RepID=UPI002FD2A9C3